ncbi:MAG: hypothetical protein KF715_10590 [Candidatus Didemnitutus sp.]|nr:hypothetical protein [Candidatus Didemnitutus sp.]
MYATLKSKVFLSGVLVLALVGSSLAFRPAGRAIELPTVRTRSVEDRRESLAALQDAWENRALVTSPTNAREERMFLNRLAYFVRATQGRETYLAACQFWNRAYHDHASRYSDFIDDQE